MHLLHACHTKMHRNKICFGDIVSTCIAASPVLCMYACVSVAININEQTKMNSNLSPVIMGFTGFNTAEIYTWSANHTSQGISYDTDPV